jgi:hypothetical protein
VRSGAAAKIGLCPCLAQPQRQRMERLDQWVIPPRLGIDDHFFQCEAGQFLLLAVLQRAEARHQPRLQRKSGKELLRKTVDRLNAQSAACRLQHAGEELARARARISGVISSPSAFRSSASAGPSICTQAARRAWIRSAISVAPALVKVRQRICSGSTPPSSRRNTRAVNTWVLPVPADAESQTCASGAEARA